MADTVDAYIAALAHTRKDEVLRLHAALLAADPAITATVKWNSPNYRYRLEDRATMRLNPGNRLELVLHTGAKGRIEQPLFPRDNPLVDWVDPARGVIRLADRLGFEAQLEAIVALTTAWMRALA